MTYRIQLAPHLSTEDLFARYRGEKRSAEKTHWQVLWLLSQGKTSQEAADVTGYSSRWVRRLVARYNAGGPEAMRDRRRENKRQPLLNEGQRAELSTALEGEAPGGGLWSGPEVARWMSKKLGRTVRPQRGWDYLRRVGYTPQIPRPAHEKANPESQASFQGGASQTRRRGANDPP